MSVARGPAGPAEHVRHALRLLEAGPAPPDAAALTAACRHLDAALAALREPVAESPSDGPVQLSARQREIGALVSEGWTNREIAAALFLSEKTVEKHLAALAARLGVSRRAAVAARLAAVAPLRDAAGGDRRLGPEVAVLGGRDADAVAVAQPGGRQPHPAPRARSDRAVPALPGTASAVAGETVHPQASGARVVEGPGTGEPDRRPPAA